MRAKKLSRMYTVSGSWIATYTAISPEAVVQAVLHQDLEQGNDRDCGGKMIAEKITK